MYKVGLRNMTELMDTPALALWRSSMSFRSFAWPLLSDMYSSLRTGGWDDVSATCVWLSSECMLNLVRGCFCLWMLSMLKISRLVS